jgi:hypothetical protein
MREQLVFNKIKRTENIIEIKGRDRPVCSPPGPSLAPFVPFRARSRVDSASARCASATSDSKQYYKINK